MQDPLKITPLNFSLCGARVWIETDDPAVIGKASKWWDDLFKRIDLEDRIDKERHKALTQDGDMT